MIEAIIRHVADPVVGEFHLRTIRIVGTFIQANLRTGDCQHQNHQAGKQAHLHHDSPPFSSFSSVVAAGFSGSSASDSELDFSASFLASRAASLINLLLA